MKFAMVCLLVCSAVSLSGRAEAREAGENRIILRDGPGSQDVSDCQAETLDGRIVISACTKALEVVEDGTSRSVLLLFRSKANSRTGNFAQSIADADAAQVVLDSWQAQNQRCWSRLLAQSDLHVAADACEAAIGKSGARVAALDSGATLALLTKDWERASQLFWLVSTAYGQKGEYPYAEYGIYLAYRGLANTSSGDFQPIWKEKADAQRAKLGPVEQHSDYFLSLGISTSD